MITTLHIKNIGIIEDLTIDLNFGLNVLTGETGAGKTLIIDSLQIISGGRFSKEMLRHGETNAFVELCMYLPDSPKAEEGNIIISREINNTGKNLCKINGRMVTVNELKEFMQDFIEIHGQNENQNLLDHKKHLGYLDGVAGEALEGIKTEYQNDYEKYQQIQKQLKENLGDEKERQRKIDLLQYQIREIEEAKLKEHEEEELEEKRKIMINAEKIAENLGQANHCIEEEGIDSISKAIRALEKIENLDDKYANVTNQLKSIYYDLQEMARDLNDYQEEIEFDEEESSQIEKRLNLIHFLKKKYGNTIQEVIQYNSEIKSELERIENLEEINQKLREQKEELEIKLEDLARKLHTLRETAANELTKRINQELEDLEMKNAKINIQVRYLEEEYKKTGKDIVKFYIATNIGEKEKELSKIASGGEMSRIMLAIKKVLADSDQVPVLIFDEIDTGISGKAANRVAKKLQAIATKHQVLCISHLPSIAAAADFNYFISKKVKQERTKTQVKLLQEKEVIEEIARISSGEVNEITLKYATELRNKKAS